MHIWAMIIINTTDLYLLDIWKQKVKFSQLKGLGHSCLIHFENNKQLLDEVFVISRIIKVSVSVISLAKGQGW